MTESEYLEKLAQAEYDLYGIRQRIKKLGFEIAEAERQKNLPEANKKRRFLRQQERYSTYTKFYRKTLNAQYQSMLKGVRNDFQT